MKIKNKGVGTVSFRFRGTFYNFISNEIKEFSDKDRVLLTTDILSIFDDLEEVTTSIVFGDLSTDGSWRFIQVDGNIVRQRLEDGIWVDKGIFEA